MSDLQIDIVLATYNGSKYLHEQLNSIISMEGFERLVKNIIICDDNSKDNTLEIVNAIIPSEKLILLKNDREMPFGPAKNFERGIEHTTADYVMLSDQDDVWDEKKLIAYYLEAQKLDNTEPFIIFSDLEVVDSSLNTIADSFLNYQSINSNWCCDIKQLLIQNIAPGCTMMFNRNLIAKSLPFPTECLMHDWWLMLVCKLYGQIKFIDGKKFIKYRQHGGNQVGAKKIDLVNFFKNFSVAFGSASKNYSRTVSQMVDFKLRYTDDIPYEVLKYIDALSIMLDKNSTAAKRVLKALNVNVHKSSLIKTLGTYLIIIKGLK